MFKKSTILQLLFPIMIFAQLGEFSLVSPSNYSEDVDVWPLFQWQTSSNATNYLLQVSTTPQFYEGTFVSYECGNVTQFRPPVDLIVGGNAYYWRILAVNETDTLQNNSSQFPYNYWVLQTIPDSEPREILGSAPLAFNRTLITENTPYTMRQGNLVIPSNKYLKVREGITIQIEGDYYIEVNGLLQMTGTSDKNITITTANTNKSAGAWENIRFNSGSIESVFDENMNYTSGPIFQYVNFEYGGTSTQNTIYAPSTTLFVDHCRFENSFRAGAYIGGGSLITNNEIYANDNSNTCIYISETTKSIIKENTIDKGKQGIYVVANFTEIKNNIISNCIGENGGGIYAKADSLKIGQNKISGCQVNANGGGVYIEGNDISFIENEISNCFAYTYSYSSDVHCYGGGAYITGNNATIHSNNINNCYVYARHRGSDYYRYAYGYGGGFYLNINNSICSNNEISNNYAKAYKYYRYSSYAYGGGVYLTGSNNKFNKNKIKENYIVDAGGSGRHRYGAGIFISGSGNLISSSDFLYNDTQNHLGGGIFVNENGLKIDSCTFSYNKSNNGAGMYINQPNVTIDHCTITYNEATGEGAGVFGGKAIYNSTIKYNQASNLNNAGGIYGDPDTVYYCNINHNGGYEFKKSNSNDTEAIYNWWFTRSDEVNIEESIYDANDTAGRLGFATYQPFLTDVSPTTPGNFKEVTSIEAKDDSSYVAPLNRALGIGDSMFVEIRGIDSNPYNKDVTVLKVFNKRNWTTIRPFFEETEENSGIFRCKFYLADHFKLPATIPIQAGDTLVVSSDIDQSFSFEYIVPELSVVTITTVPNSFNVLLDGVSYQTPLEIKWERGSSHEISVNEIQASDQDKMRYVFDFWNDGGTITHNVVADSGFVEFQANFNLEKYQSEITFNTSPTGYLIKVDTLNFDSTPQTFLWEVGSEHQVSVKHHYNLTNDSRNTFNSWGITQDTLFTLNVGSVDTTFLATYVKQYQLNINIGEVDTVFTDQIQIFGSGWHFENDSTEIWIEPDTVKIFDGVNEKSQYFTGWSPNIQGYPSSANRVKFKITAPVELTATWSDIHITDIAIVDDIIPKEFRVSQNYPNPFNPITTIDYDIPHQTNVKIELFNILGQRIAVLLDDVKVAGKYKLVLDGKLLPSSTYLLRVTTDKYSEIRKLILLK